MPDRSSTNEHLAKAVTNTLAKAKNEPTKNPAAVALGRIGGLKGGKARAEKLSSKKRQAIARKAAKARWSKKEESE